MYAKHKADRGVAEVNQGGAHVQDTLRRINANLLVRTFHARRSQQLRAESVVALCEQGRVHHVGALAELEEQCRTWVPPGHRAQRGPCGRLGLGLGRESATEEGADDHLVTLGEPGAGPVAVDVPMTSPTPQRLPSMPCHYQVGASHTRNALKAEMSAARYFPAGMFNHWSTEETGMMTGVVGTPGT